MTTSKINEIFSHRLRQARTMAKLSLRQLAEKMENRVSHNALSKYEKGEMLPGGEILAALSLALDQPADFFFRKFRVEIEGINFRKKCKLSVTEQKAIQEKAKEFFERYTEIEQLLECAVPYEPPFDDSDVVIDEAAAEEAANRLREVWNLGTDPLPNLHELMELKGIKVHEAKTGDSGFDGFSGTINSTPVVVVAGWLNENLPRKRMTEAHELAHIIVKTPAAFSPPDEERVAKRFAGAFLLPKESFIEMFGGSRTTIALGELIHMKIYFGVSIMAIMKRAEQLNLITPAVYQRFCIVANRQGWRTRGEPGDERYKGNESHGRFRQLVFRAVAEGVISSSKAAAYLQISLDEFRGEFQQLFA